MPKSRITALLIVAALLVGAACSPPKRTAPTPRPTVARTEPPVKELQLPKESRLTVTPSSGSVGSKVTLEGKGCGYVGRPVHLNFFRGSPRGTSGSDDAGISAVHTKADGTFKVGYTIPPRFKEGSLNGSGGGPLYSGMYEFGSEPQFCSTDFRVFG